MANWIRDKFLRLPGGISRGPAGNCFVSRLERKVDEWFLAIFELWNDRSGELARNPGDKVSTKYNSLSYSFTTSPNNKITTTNFRYRYYRELDYLFLLFFASKNNEERRLNLQEVDWQHSTRVDSARSRKKLREGIVFESVRQVCKTCVTGLENFIVLHNRTLFTKSYASWIIMWSSDCNYWQCYLSRWHLVFGT